MSSLIFLRPSTVSWLMTFDSCLANAVSDFWSQPSDVVRFLCSPSLLFRGLTVSAAWVFSIAIARNLNHHCSLSLSASPVLILLQKCGFSASDIDGVERSRCETV